MKYIAVIFIVLCSCSKPKTIVTNIIPQADSTKSLYITYNRDLFYIDQILDSTGKYHLGDTVVR